MPPASKPASRRQRKGHGAHNVAPLNLVVYNDGAVSPSEIPMPPGGLLPTTVMSWNTYWTSELARAVTLPTDLPALHRLFRYYDDLERSWEIYLRDPEVIGSTGQTRISHFAKHIAELEPMIRALEDRFGLSPKARLELGVTLGDAARSLEDLYRPAKGDPGIPAELFVPTAPVRVSSPS